MSEPLKDTQLRHHFLEMKYNIGAVCGKVSDLTVLDKDWIVKGLWDDIFQGVDRANWITQHRKPGKEHIFFRYTDKIKHKNEQVLGFDLLNESSNIVLAPSVHKEGQKYAMQGDITKRPEMPDIVADRIDGKCALYDNLSKTIGRCRHVFRELWKAVFIDKKHKLYHDTTIFRLADGRLRTLALFAELKCAGATDEEMRLACQMIFGGDYNEETTMYQLSKVEAEKTAKTETIQADTILVKFYDPHVARSEGKKLAKASGATKEQKDALKPIIVLFDQVGEWILKENHIFSMRDNGQIFLYQHGVYRNEGSEAILRTMIRDAYYSLYVDMWQEKNPDIDLPEHIPKATAKYVNEVLAYIRDYTHIRRDSLEGDHAKYINFKNCLFNLETWKTEEHRPEIKTISQIPVNYSLDAKCPKINNFLESVVAEPDINLLCEIAGYCLTTDCSHQKAFMLYGVGSNGKSVFLALLEALIGGENTSAESLQKLEFDKYRTAKLYGKRVNICGDIPDSKMHKSEVFKKLTSGLDLIDGENKYQDSFVFRNTAKLVFSANILPEGKKDKAYYRRWILIQFPNNFEGTNDDKSLINKLREAEELSGFLNLALEGLKRLTENGKFSNDKSIEDTQREYEFNSNPIAAFMDECTTGSQEDIDAIKLYSTYTLWAEVNNKRKTAYNQWGKELKKLGFENYRGNVGGSNCSKKVSYWCNIEIIPEAQDRLNWKKDKIACPNYTVSTDSEKTKVGQAGQAYTLPLTRIDNKPYWLACLFHNVEEDKKGKKSENSENAPTINPEACPNKRFFDSVRDRTGTQDKLENVPVLEQITLFSEQSDEPDAIKNLKHLRSFKTDLKNLVKSDFNGLVESVPDVLDIFNRRFPGYKQIFGYQTLLDEAEQMNQWGWK